MYKVVCVVDKERTALDRLAQGVKPYHMNIEYHVVAVHPKRPSPEQLQKFLSLAQTADVIDYQYFRTAEMLRKNYDWLKDIPSILTHNNPYSIKESDWNSYQINVGNNNEIYGNLRQITSTKVEKVPIVVDPHQWTFNDNYDYNRSIIMVANRIESKKGILPVALACKALGIKMYLVGAISDMAYWQEVMATQAVEFAQEVTDDELKALYYKAGILVCNSVDGFESGTMPVLEAIFCGVPVISRAVGHVPDILNGDNIMIQDKAPDDVIRIQELISELLADKKRIDRVRHEAWLKIKDRNFERRAYMYQRLYRSLTPGEPVSIVIPVANKPEVTSKCLTAALNQTYPNIELLVIDDGVEPQHQTVASIALTANIPIRYIRLGDDKYNLAKARNIAAIEATSDILVFCDQRMIMDKDCVDEFVKNLEPKKWLYGSKGVKKDFIENISCINRNEFFTFGMFSERCEQYGALSQETRLRARRQGFDLKYAETAKATPEGKSSNKRSKKYEIMASKNWLWKAGLEG
jgi:glycosyltransferase involved in cell wall biosynthesis/GT2 family glycosyltransferase